MGTRGRNLLLFTAAILMTAGSTFAQDAPSLGDIARQKRQKEQAKAASVKDTKAAKVITNEELPESAQRVSAPATGGGDPAFSPSTDGAKQPAEQWKSQISGQKNHIASLQRQVEDLNESIRFAPANCVANCVAWNERQREKQQQVERMQAQLEDQKRRLDEMQESARKQGYGSSVYDP